MISFSYSFLTFHIHILFLAFCMRNDIRFNRLIMDLILLQQGEFNLKMMNNDQGEIHVIKTSVMVKKVAITVRFPCSITFSLKGDNQMVDHKGVYKLQKGESIINQMVEIEQEVSCFRGKYEEKKIQLLVYMVSQNGKIPAGSVTINPTERTVVDKRMPLQKCPDKNAEVIFTENYEKVRFVKKVNEVKRGSINLAASSVSTVGYLNKNNNNYASTSSLQKMASEDGKLRQSRQSSKNQIDQGRSLKTSNVGSQSDQKLFLKYSRARVEQPKKSYGTSQKDAPFLRMSRASNHVAQQMEWEIQSQRGKIMRLQQQKTDYIKQIAKARGSLARVQSQERFQIDETRSRNSPNYELQQQVQKLKEKIRIQERKEKQSGHFLKELKEDLDKKKSKVVQLDTQRSNFQNLIGEKERMISQLQNEKRKIQDSLQQEKSINQSFQKKLQIKQNSYKEQLKKMTERITVSESDRQKAMLDYNSLLTQVQTSQKKYQLSLRQKDKAYSEEKLRQAKKIQQLLGQIAELKENTLQSQHNIAQLEFYKKKIIQQSKQKDDQIAILKQKNEKSLIQNTALQLQKKRLKEDCQKLQSLTSQDKLNYKKKYNEAVSELSTYKQKIQRNNFTISSLQQKLKDFEIKLQSQTRQKSLLSKKLDEIKKAYQKQIEQQLQRERLAETLSMQNVSQNQKLNDFRSRLESERRRYQSMQAQYEEQVLYLVKSKQYLENQLQDNKLALQAERQKFMNINTKHRDLNEQMIELNQQIIILQQKLVLFEEQRENYQGKINSQGLQISHLLNKNNQLSEFVKKKDEEIYQLQKKLSALEHQIVILQESHENSMKKQRITIQILQNNIEKLNSSQRGMEDEIQKLIEENNRAQQSEFKLKNQNIQKTNQLQLLRQANKSLDGDLKAMLNRNQKLKYNEESQSEKLNNIQTNISQLQGKLLMSESQNKKIRKQYHEYQNTWSRDLQQLFKSLSKDLQQKKGQNRGRLIKVSNPILSSITQQYLHDYNQKMQQLYAQISKYQQAEADHQQAFIKQKQQYQQLKQDLEQKLGNASSSLSRQRQNYLQQCLTLKEQINNHQQQIKMMATEAQKNILKIEDNEQNIFLLSSQLQQLKKERVELYSQINKLQTEVQLGKQRERKQNLHLFSENEQLKQLSQLERKRTEQNNSFLTETLKTKEKQLGQKIEQIKRINLLMEQLKIKIDRSIVDKKQNQTLLAEEIKKTKYLQKQLGQKQKIVKELKEQIFRLSQQTKSSSQRQLQLQLKVKNLQAQVASYSQQERFSKNQHQSLNTILQQSERREREKRQKLQLIRAKLQQQNKAVRQKCAKLQSEVQFHKFFKEESTRKLQQYEKFKEQNYVQILRQKQQMIKNQKELGNYQNQHYKLQLQIQHLTKERDLLTEANMRLKGRVEELEEDNMNINQSTSDLQETYEEKIKLLQQLQQQNTSYKITIAKTKEQLQAKSSRVKQLQKKMQDKNLDISQQRKIWQQQISNERDMFDLKIQTLSENMRVLQEQIQFQKQQATREIQQANTTIQQLNEIIRQKQQSLQSKQQIINEQLVRLDELNLQLAQCINKWEKEKQIYVPASTKITDISEQLLRMNNFISNLDGRNKQLLEISKRKMQQTVVEGKPTITQLLKQLNTVIQRNKNRMISRMQTEKEKETVMNEFKVIQQKMDLTIRSVQVVTVKQ